MMTKWLITWLCALSGVLAAQHEVVDFFVDPVGKAYYLLADEQLVTDNPTGQNRFVFYDSSLGAPTSVDVTNPFAILLFYADYGTVVLLDRTLSEVSRLDLFAGEAVLQPEALARAADDGLWVFDGWDYRLKLLDATGAVRLQSNDLRLALQLKTAPAAIYVNGGEVLLHYRDEQRLAIFTAYGRFQRWIDLPAADHFGWYAPVLTGTTDSVAWTYRGGEPAVRNWPQRPATANGDQLTPLGGKRYWQRQGYYGLDASGRSRLLPFPQKARKEK